MSSVASIEYWRPQNSFFGMKNQGDAQHFLHFGQRTGLFNTSSKLLNPCQPFLQVVFLFLGCGL